MERYYMNANQTEVWRVTDKEIRYIRLIPKSSVTGEEDYCYCKKATTADEVAWLEKWETVADWGVFSAVMVKYFQVMKAKTAEVEKVFKISI